MPCYRVNRSLPRSLSSVNLLLRSACAADLMRGLCRSCDGVRWLQTAWIPWTFREGPCQRMPRAVARQSLVMMLAVEGRASGTEPRRRRSLKAEAFLRDSLKERTTCGSTSSSFRRRQADGDQTILLLMTHNLFHDRLIDLVPLGYILFTGHTDN